MGSCQPRLGAIPAAIRVFKWMIAVTKLSVNLNAVAFLRNRRDLAWPSVTGIGRAVLDAGAAGLTVHPRPDERHIRRADVPALKALLNEYPGREFNIEGYPDAAFLDLVASVRADQVTFVPDSPEQSTSDHGWDLAASRDVLLPAIGRMQALGTRVSLFIDPDPAVPAQAKALGADRVELYTAPYNAAVGTADHARVLAAFRATAEAARDLGLGVNAGHDLTFENLPDFVTVMPFIAEVSIGHAITADALMVGFPEATRQYVRVLGGTA